jgi:hypothetical protein
MCSYRARRNFKGEKTTTSVGPNLLLAIRIDSGSMLSKPEPIATM